MASWYYRVGGPLLLAAPLAVVLAFRCAPARGVPAFAQQTGQPCAACHVGAFGPQLTPLGRLFKMSGYTMTGGEGIASKIPLAAMIIGSFTHTAKSQPSPPQNDFGRNNNVALDQVSLFLAGRLTDNVGAFIQGTYSGTAKAFSLDNADVRLTAPYDVGGSELRVGASLNNGPTVQDPYNTTFVWGYPFAQSALAPTPTAQPLLAGGLIGNSIGLTAYALYDRHLYLEAGGYETYGPSLLSATGTTYGPGSTANVAPYGRLAYEWDWAGQSAHVGAIFLSSNINPAIGDRTAQGALGKDRFTDLGADAGYQFLGDGPHTATLDAILVHEFQDLKGTFNMGGASRPDHALNQVRTNATYYYRNTYGLTLAWQYTWGTPDPVLYAPAPVMGSANGKPDSNAFIVEADWVPFGKEDSWRRPFANLKLGLQYIIYTLFNGGTRNYDGFGHDASGNNTLFLYAWTVF